MRVDVLTRLNWSFSAGAPGWRRATIRRVNALKRNPHRVLAGVSRRLNVRSNQYSLATIYPFTTHAIAAPLMHLSIAPSSQNGLKVESQLMIDKVTTVAKVKLKRRVGRLADEDVVRVNRAVLVFLGLAGSRAR
ncbi:MAG: type II toxin-antitoxin system PemK/MazF family toxin [Acidobacteria bacterium]|nr:type II toxin-antitoxin system PemK/MazF family toxin [Acidobacteriota bacterium]